jgi:exodeoxyribonuclease V alpha subunit
MNNNIFKVVGAVNEIVSKSNDPKKPNVIFTLKTASGKTYKAHCPYFCPVSSGDGIYCVAELQDVNNLKILKPPLVNIPVDKDNTLQFFLKTLRGTKFGTVSCEKLYSELEKLAKDFKYGSEFACEEAIESKESKSYLTITNESRYFGDGVIAFLSEFSAEFIETKNEKIINMIAGKTINKPQAKKLLEEWHNKRSMRRLYLLGLTRTEILCSGKNLEELYKICLENPYRISSIHYDKCEKILSTVGKVPTDEQKDCGRINRFVYDNANTKGWMCSPAWIVRRALPKYDTYKDILVKDYDLVEVNDKVYTTYNYKVEFQVGQYLNTLIGSTAEEYAKLAKVGEPDIVSKFYECKTLTDEQKKAIDGALRSKVSIIAGGAGVGKSTMIREITRNFSMRGIDHAVVAFTGKAVSRLHDIMKNKNASTIDRFIMKTKERSVNDPKYDKGKLQYIIIDEISMVTTELFYRLINQLNSMVSFIFIGDQNQLPPIGAGSLMKEIMNSGRIPIFYLTQNQRIIPHSNNTKSPTKSIIEAPSDKEFDRAILENANALIDPKRNRKSPLTYKEGSGFYILEGNKDTVHTIVSSLKKSGCEGDRITIISPYKAPLDELNSIFQDVYFGEELNAENSYYQSIPSGKRLWCIDDRVMMNTNNYKINVMNGEQGKVIGIQDEGVKVEFDDKVQHLFKFSSGLKEEDLGDIDETSKNDELYVDYLSHSAALSVHRVQGSEYEYVILYIPEDKSFSNFLNINLLYTAITRTKRSIWIIGNKTTLEKISMTDMPIRHDGLASMLRIMKNEESEKILESFIQVPEVSTASHFATALTTTHESYNNSYDSGDDLFALFGID